LAVDIFITDIGLPDGTGLDLLWKLACTHPSARAIVITATPLPEYQAHSAALGVLHFLEKPLKLPALVERLRQALDINLTPECRDFRATLENVTAADVVQLKCLGRATTLMEFQSDGRVGCIRFEDGEIAHAETGGIGGLEALYEILAWKRGQVSERSFIGAPRRTIEGSWQALLMEAAQRCDERAATAA
jgi:response regulator RpfG family c-di-GMP phosphodiesterase